MNISPDTNSCMYNSSCEEHCDGYTDDEIHQFIRDLKIDQKYIENLISTCKYVSRYVRIGRGLTMKSSLTQSEEKFRDVIYDLIKRKNPNDITMLTIVGMDYYHEMSKIHVILPAENALLKIRSETFSDCILDIKKRIREMGVNSDTIPDSTLFERAKECCGELAKQIVINVINECVEEEILKIQKMV